MKILVFVLISFITVFAQQDTIITTTGEIISGKILLIKENSIEFMNEKGTKLILYREQVSQMRLMNLPETKEISTSETHKIINDYINPDGNNLSFHFTPYSLSGSFSEVIYGKEISEQYEETFGYKIAIKIPWDKVTISPFFETNTLKFKSSNRKIQLFGATISFYLD